MWRKCERCASSSFFPGPRVRANGPILSYSQYWWRDTLLLSLFSLPCEGPVIYLLPGCLIQTPEQALTAWSLDLTWACKWGVWIYLEGFCGEGGVEVPETPWPMWRCPLVTWPSLPALRAQEKPAGWYQPFILASNMSVTHCIKQRLPQVWDPLCPHPQNSWGYKILRLGQVCSILGRTQ